MRDIRVNFYEINGTKAKNCLKRYIGNDALNENNKDMVLLFPGPGKQHVANNFNGIWEEKKINKWIHQTIVNTFRKFTRRAVDTIVHNRSQAMVFLRKGGKPKSTKTKDVKADESLTEIEKNAIIAFEDLHDRIARKQDRLVFFYADPERDMPV